MPPPEPTQQDLFGQDLYARTPLERKRAKRRAKETPRGYYAPPGTGPAGETYKTCRHAVKISGGNRAFWKCDRRRASWTRSYGTDIRVGAPACKGWEAKAEAVAIEIEV